MSSVKGPAQLPSIPGRPGGRTCSGGTARNAQPTQDRTMRRWTKLGVPARILVGIHVAYAIAFALVAVAVLLPSSDPGLDEWPVNPTLAILPLSLIFALGAFVLLFGITEWVGRGRKGILFALDWAVPVFRDHGRGDSLRDPGLLLENVPSTLAFSR